MEGERVRNEHTIIAISRVLRGACSVAAVVACLITCFSTQSWCADRKGTYDSTCSEHIFRLSAPRGSAQKDELILHLKWGHGLYPPAWVSAERHEVTAKRCPPESEECEDAVKGTIQFDQIGKHISGSFDVDFANEHEQGKFKVKYHRHGPKMICE